MPCEVLVPADFNDLIPELASWNEGKGIDVVSWLGCIGRYDHAIAYAALFWPEFVVHDECIFFDVPEERNYREWMENLNGDRTQVEQMLNHRHIADLFYNSEFKPSDEVLKYIGQLLFEMWTCKLKRDFPQAKIQVALYGDESGDPQITFFRARA